MKSLNRGGRKSQYELLRLVAQYFIVLYHLLLNYVVPYSDNVYMKALELTLHIGVILFVLLSGYFGIRPTSKGLLKLLFIFFVYSLPEMYFKIADAESLKDVAKALLFFSHTHFWFIRTYIFLYLLSPMVNYFIKIMNEKQRWYILGALFFITIYIGTAGGDVTLSDGKNVTNFIFLYLVGNTLHLYQDKIDKYKASTYAMLFIVFNILLVVGYSVTANGLLGKVIWQLSYAYSSPILLLNSIVFFAIFSRMSFCSTKINWLAQSALAIYLIHGNRPLFSGWDGITGHIMKCVYHNATNDVMFLAMLMLSAFTIICIAIFIDKLLTPLWSWCNSCGERVYNRLGY